MIIFLDENDIEYAYSGSLSEKQVLNFWIKKGKDVSKWRRVL